MKKCNAVFEGGGVRGIGHVGAVCRMEQAGWQFADTAGSSAGAIVAALLAAGYTGKELKKELETLDYMRFKGMDLPDYFGAPGRMFSLIRSLGIYNTDDLEDWMDELLDQKGMRRFGDVEAAGRMLKITASDLTEKRLLILPDDLEDFAVSNVILPIGSLCYLLFCVTRYGWGFDAYLAETNTGTGMKMPKWIRFYVAYILPVLLVFLIVLGWIG